MYIITFILSFIPFIISSFTFRIDPIYYNSLHKPTFIMNNNLHSFIWIVIFILLSISITICFKKNKNKDYLYTVISNYISIYLFIITFFNLKSPLFGVLMNIAVCISSIFLYIETKKISKKSSYLIIPYILMNIYSLTISILILSMNL